MKNLVWAIGALIIVIVGVFAFTSQKNDGQSTIIPSPVSVVTPSPDVANLDLNQQQQKEIMNLPFTLLKNDEIAGKKVVLSTNKGEIVIELFADAPIASSNFISLVNKKFYDGLIFHRVIKGFMIQGGDPKGDGTGGPGYQFPDEKVSLPYTRGTVAMANAGPNTNGSQFFIMHQNYNLPPSYTVFGKVVEGIEIVDEIANTEVDDSDRPLESAAIQKAILQ